MTRGFYVAESKFNVKIIKFEMADLRRPDKFKQFYLAFFAELRNNRRGGGKNLFSFFVFNYLIIFLHF